ncbi:hypothetical protein DE146DRAFT_231491 [Phaeosphaeria sp. MPI-PUGE-AT-0046c]|nr:hypothetical protein DE146DRAFT_231491 [Phaeosphaeria sp. MPI-PUGE-AT-0046c]
MFYFTKQLLRHSLFALFLAPSVFGQDCSMQRDLETCKAKTWSEEYRCLMKQNSLRTVMDCVEITANKNGNKEWTLCRPSDDGNPNTYDDEEFEFQSTAVKGQWCTEPRLILIKGPMTYTNGKYLSIRGALKACPKNDPDFHHCLCMQNVQLSAMNELAKYFKAAKENLGCNRLASRSTSFLDDVVNSTHLHEAEEAQRRSLDARAPYNFVIDAYGRPSYTDGTIGQRLPYFDQYILNGRYGRRCYVHPEVPEVAGCRTWLLPTPVSTNNLAAPTKAVYRNNFAPTSSDLPTITVAPSIASYSEVIVSDTALLSTTAAAVSSATVTPSAGAQPSAGSMTKPSSGWILLQASVVIITSALLLV